MELAGIVALLAAGFLLIARLLKLGFIADFLSQTVLAGFLTGVGIQVGIAVLGEMLGVSVDTHKTLEQLARVVSGLGEAHLGTMGISAAVVAVIVLSHRISPQLPGPLFAVAGATAASALFDFAGHGVNVIGPVMGGLPRLRLPLVSGAEVLALLPVAASCFVMIVAQSAATARAYAFRHREALDENTDLAGLSAANVAAAVTGTFVVNGSPTQTAMVDRSGGRSQLAHLVVAALVAVVLLVLTGPLQYLPRCVLGAIVFTIALGLVDLRSLREIQRESPGEFLLAAGTAAVVVAIGVGQGIVLAMAYSLLRHVRHSYRPHSAVLVEDAGASWRPTPAVPGIESAPGLIVFQFGADLFYANADRFAGDVRGLVDRALTPVRWLIVDAGAITSVDYSAARVLRALVDDLSRGGVVVLLVHAEASLLGDLRRHRLTDVAAPGRAFNTLREALAVIRGAEGKDSV